MDAAVATGGSYVSGNIICSSDSTSSTAASGFSATHAALGGPNTLARQGDVGEPGPAPDDIDTSKKLPWEAIGSGILKKWSCFFGFLRQKLFLNVMTTFSTLPKPMRSMTSCLLVGSGGSNVIVPAFNTPKEARPFLQYSRSYRFPRQFFRCVDVIWYWAGCAHISLPC